MKEEFAMCSRGKVQSPINIIPTEDIDLKALDFKYNTNSMDVVNNGHTVQVNILAGSTVNIAGTDYELKYFIFTHLVKII